MIIKVKSAYKFQKDFTLLCAMCDIDHRQIFKSQTVGDWVNMDVDDDLIAQLKAANPKATASLLNSR